MCIKARWTVVDVADEVLGKVKESTQGGETMDSQEERC